MAFKKFTWAFVFCLVLTTYWGKPATAHPHVFIAQKTTVAFDANGLAGFRIHWTFDDMFSVMIQEDFDQNHDGRLSKEEVAVIKEKAFGYTAEHNYFIHIRIDGTPFDVKYVTQFNAKLDNGKLSYDFFIPCHVKGVSGTKSIILSPYDEGYYSAIYFPDNGALMLENQSAFIVKTKVQRDMDTLIYYETVNPMAIFLNFRLKP